MNAEAGSTVWAFIKPASAPPTDYIANGILYRIGVVTPVGAPQLLTYTNPSDKSRDSLIQVQLQLTLLHTDAAVVLYKAYAWLCT
jgi:predicted extracellular nuclease